MTTAGTGWLNDHMKRSGTPLLAVLLFGLEAGALAQRQPHIGYVYPAGGQQGTTLTVTVGGQSLEGVTSAYVSGKGIRTTILKYEHQVTPQAQDELAKRLAQLREKRQKTGSLSAAEEKLAEEIRTTLTRFGRQLANPALNQFVTLQFRLAPDAPIGKREVRLGTSAGLSNPLGFWVGALPEFSKKDWKNVPKARGSMDPALDPSPMEMKITTPAVVNGQLQPGGVDRYRFKGRQGQPFTALVSARGLLPYLPDAVPGWLEATVRVLDAAGAEVPFEEGDHSLPDCAVFCNLPRDGEYLLEIRDSLYRGREDFVYRITVGELPFVTGWFPLGGKAGSQPLVALSGRNLSRGDMPLDLRQLPPGTYPFVVTNAVGPSRSLLFAVDTLPECLEREPNDLPASAQPVTLPVIVNGRIDAPGDVDVFEFKAEAGEKIVAEVLARRLGSPVDSFLRLTDSAGKQLAFNDDYEDKGAGLDTSHADSYLSATLPETGTYFLHLGDTQHGGGSNYVYRLRISPPRPDFELRVAPSSLNVRGGTSVALTVAALRKDGFDGEISLALKNAPDGFVLSGARVPAGEDKVKMTLTVPPVPHPEPLTLHIEGRAVIAGREAIRPGVPADDLMQAFSYRHLVPAQELKVAVWGDRVAQNPPKILTRAPLKIPCGGTARIEVDVPASSRMGEVRIELDGAPEGITIENVTHAGENTTLVVRADAAVVKPGHKGNLVLQAFAEHPPESAGEKRQPNRRGIFLGALPALPFEVGP